MTETNCIEFKRKQMRVFRDVEMVESLGSGMNRIMRIYGRENFEFGGNYVRMIVPYNWIPEEGEAEYEEFNEGGQKNRVETGIDQKKWPEKWPEKWPKKAETIVSMINQNQGVTISDFENELGVGHTTVKKILKEMQAEGFIRRDGPDKGGHWIVLKSEKPTK